MRTTLTIDDHLMRELKEYAHRRGLPLKQVVNQALRSGLTHLLKPAPRRRYKCRTYSMGHPSGAQLEKAFALAAVLEDEETVRKLALRK
jgi:hypothetical protein